MTKCSNFLLLLLLKLNYWRRWIGGLWSFTLLLCFKSVYMAVIHKRIWTIEILTNEHEINKENLIDMVENLVFNYVLLWLINMGKKMLELT